MALYVLGIIGALCSTFLVGLFAWSVVENYRFQVRAVAAKRLWRAREKQAILEVINQVQQQVAIHGTEVCGHFHVAMDLFKGLMEIDPTDCSKDELDEKYRLCIDKLAAALHMDGEVTRGPSSLSKVRH
jgi:hypothetical protein